MNRLFLVAITGEMCLFTVGLRFPYNPFVQFKKQYELQTGFKIKTRDHLTILRDYVLPIYADNQMEPHKLLPKTIEKLFNQKVLVEQEQMSNHDRIFK